MRRTKSPKHAHHYLFDSAAEAAVGRCKVCGKVKPHTGGRPGGTDEYAHGVRFSRAGLADVAAREHTAMQMVKGV